ncbi:MAG: GNAT family N-acetyltransferase [Synechococcaceae cyanobacterium]
MRQDCSENFSLLDVGGQVKYLKTQTSFRSQDDHQARIAPYTETEVNSDILSLVYLSGHLSRFRIDPFLPVGSFERLYRTWIANTLERAPRATIVASYAEGRAVGMITAEWDQDTCSIGLLAVNPSYQGLGIGTQLLKHVERLSADKNIFSLEVKTQLSNTGAQTLYLKNAFSEVHRTFLYHAHLLPCQRSKSHN